jgi:hypothetical protein
MFFSKRSVLAQEPINIDAMKRMVRYFKFAVLFLQM